MENAEFGYELHLLPAGRFPFRRWRYELWHGATLLRAGWRTTRRDAERALRVAATHIAHDRLGLPVVHAERGLPDSGPHDGMALYMRIGVVSCALLPRAAAA
jgi:hypothetical protein